MSDPRDNSLRERFKTLVFYALVHARAEVVAGTPSLVCEPGTLLALEYQSQADVAPYLTVLPVEELLGSLAAMIELAADDPLEAKPLEWAYQWMKGTQRSIVGFQLEPKGIAGEGIANIEQCSSELW